MRILRQTATRLVTQHHQIGERLAATCCLLLAVGASLLACPVPEISCQRNGTLTQCKLIRHIFGRWQLEQLIVLQGVRSEGICVHSRRSGSDCSHDKFVAIVQTQIGKIHFVRYASSEGKAIADIQRFIQDSNQTSLNIQSANWSLNHPISNGLLLMFAIVMLVSACNRLGSEQTYKCVFDKTEDWVTVTQQQMSMSKVTEFPISSIKSITVHKIGNGNCIVLTLQSGQHVCVTKASWGKKNLKKDMQPIASFLQV